MSDNTTLFSLAKKGDIDAFEKLMEPYYKAVYRLALKAAVDRNDASELAQEVFVRLFNTIGEAGVQNLPLFVLRTAVDICSPGIKKQKTAGMAVIGRAT